MENSYWWPGEARLKESIGRLRQAAFGKTAAELKREVAEGQAVALERSRSAEVGPLSAEALAARLEELEKEVSRMRESDGRLLRAVLMAAALLVAELLIR
jgi:hypothetical protein